MHTPRVPVVLAAIAMAACAQNGVPDLLYHGGRMMGDVRTGGMANAGTALRGGALSVWTNPALVHAYCRDNGYRGLVSGLSYSRSSPLYDGLALNVGAGYYGGSQGSIINAYRYLRGSDEPQTDYQTLLTYAAQMFERGEKQGPVDYGISLRYEQANWRTVGLPSLYTVYRPAGQAEWLVLDSAMAPEGSLLEKRLLFDLGFFQADALGKLDFSLVFHNLLGYIWRDIRPVPVERAVLHNDSLLNDTLYRGYETEYRSDNGWIDGWYRRLTVGTAFQSSPRSGKLHIRVPLDLEVVGLFDRSRETLLLFRCGAELTIGGLIVLRAGYGREPELVALGKDAHNVNVFAGGAGVRWKSLHVDGYVSRQQWGLGLSIDY